MDNTTTTTQASTKNFLPFVISITVILLFLIFEIENDSLSIYPIINNIAKILLFSFPIICLIGIVTSLRNLKAKFAILLLITSIIYPIIEIFTFVGHVFIW